MLKLYLKMSSCIKMICTHGTYMWVYLCSCLWALYSNHWGKVCKLNIDKIMKTVKLYIYIVHCRATVYELEPSLQKQRRGSWDCVAVKSRAWENWNLQRSGGSSSQSFRSWKHLRWVEAMSRCVSKRCWNCSKDM